MLQKQKEMGGDRRQKKKTKNMIEIVKAKKRNKREQNPKLKILIQLSCELCCVIKKNKQRNKTKKTYYKKNKRTCYKAKNKVQKTHD